MGGKYSQLREIAPATIKKLPTLKESRSLQPAPPGVGRIQVLLCSHVVREDTSDINRVTGPSFGSGAADPWRRKPAHGPQGHDGCRSQRHAHVWHLRRV